MKRIDKIAVSLPEEQIAAARRAVAEGRAASVSAYVSQALAAREREETLSGVVADLITELGRPSSEAYAWADEVLDAGHRPS
jgi:antitoxin ParD1/3/4